MLNFVEMPIWYVADDVYIWERVSGLKGHQMPILYPGNWAVLGDITVSPWSWSLTLNPKIYIKYK